MEHQYPDAISGDESMLAELMLPDQAHARKEDWTIFFLHKDTAEEEETGEEGQEKNGNEASEKSDAISSPDGIGDAEKEEGKQEAERGEQQDDPEGGEGPPLIYVLNLVNTKHDAKAKR